MKLSKDQINEVVNFIENCLRECDYLHTGFQEYWYKSNVSYWSNSDLSKERIYINMKYGRNYKGQNKWKRGVSYAIDLIKESIFDCSNDYNNASERRTIKDIAKEALDFALNL